MTTLQPNGDDAIRMGHDLIDKLLANPASFSQYNELLVQFFRGLPVSALGELLRHPEERVILGALFIAEELGTRAAKIISDIIPHSRDRRRKVRIAAYGTLCACATGESAAAFAHVVLGLLDADPHCRKVAALCMIRVPTALLNAAVRALDPTGDSTGVREGLQRLLGPPMPDAGVIRSWIASDEPLTRTFGVIAAGRSVEATPELLELAADSHDEDVRICATAQRHFNVFQQRARRRKGMGDKGSEKGSEVV